MRLSPELFLTLYSFVLPVLNGFNKNVVVCYRATACAGGGVGVAGREGGRSGGGGGRHLLPGAGLGAAPAGPWRRARRCGPWGAAWRPSRGRPAVSAGPGAAERGEGRARPGGRAVGGSGGGPAGDGRAGATGTGACAGPGRFPGPRWGGEPRSAATPLPRLGRSSRRWRLRVLGWSIRPRAVPCRMLPRWRSSRTAAAGRRQNSRWPCRVIFLYKKIAKQRIILPSKIFPVVAALFWRCSSCHTCPSCLLICGPTAWPPVADDRRRVAEVPVWHWSRPNSLWVLTEWFVELRALGLLSAACL